MTIERKINEHNAPLDQMMLDQGYTFKQTSTHEHYVDADGSYVPFPNGYVRGPHYHSNGNPRPWSYSIQGEGGWMQFAFPIKREADEWIVEQMHQWALKQLQRPAAESVSEPAAPPTYTGTEIAIAVALLVLAVLGMLVRGW